MENLEPIFCDYCSERMGWVETANDVHTKLICDACKEDQGG